jgi:hypothetical protein
VHLVSDILPDAKSISFGKWGVEIVREGYEDPDLHYIIGEYDGHPNSTSHEAIAEYVAKQIVKD